jgi:ATP:corrinoid adenosyltransferase
MRAVAPSAWRSSLSGRVTDLRGEIIAAHPSRVAQADQIAAAEPRREPSTVVLDEWLPTTHVYVLNLDEMQRMLDESLANMRFDP